MEDRIFQKPIEKQFEFDEDVAAVFDDMISRSVPFYAEAQELIKKIVLKNTKEGSLVYDLGSSTGSTLINISDGSKKLNLVGIDNSKAMVERARKKARAYGADIEFVEADILDYEYEMADIFLANYTLQFIRPIKRDKFVKKIYSKLKSGGLFIFSEKVISEDKKLGKQLIDIYYDYKKARGYTDFEISQKREALENVLIPYSLKENEEMVKEAGFEYVEILFKWANFAVFLAKKG